MVRCSIAYAEDLLKEVRKAPARRAAKQIIDVGLLGNSRPAVIHFFTIYGAFILVQAAGVLIFIGGLDTVVRDGQATYDEVYRGIPEAERPPRP